MESSPATITQDSRINDDLSLRVVLNTADLPWVPSPTEGVERKLLERDGGEVARATSLVQYAPGSGFAGHDHPGGEEIFVLEGVYQDENGRYTKGTYLRNPPGSSHTPISEEGCLLFVRLMQMNPGDTGRLVIDSNNLSWQPGRTEGIEIKSLFRSETTPEWVYLVRFQPGAGLGLDTHEGGEELYVLSGVQEDEHGQYPAGTWVRQPRGSVHTPHAPQGSTVLVRRGHMLE